MKIGIGICVCVCVRRVVTMQCQSDSGSLSAVIYSTDGNDTFAQHNHHSNDVAHQFSHIKKTDMADDKCQEC